MNIYLDHAATTATAPEVVREIEPLFREHYGNPSSLHRMGVDAERYIKESRKRISEAIHASEREIFFTSGGTESNNLAIKGALSKYRNGRIITTAVEHPSVLNVFKGLASKGFEVIFLPVSEEGRVRIEDLDEVLTDEVRLVSMMYVNNETGAIQPVEAVAKRIKAVNEKIIFHIDAIQAFGKLAIDVKALGCDLLSLSGHKIGGVKGSGALYVRNGVHLSPIFDGGGQENKVRPGTENVIGITAFGKAAELAEAHREAAYNKTAAIKKALVRVLKQEPYIKINGAPEKDSPFILNVSFEGVRGEVFLHALEMEGIYVSTGSACNSKKEQYSHVLEAMHLSDSEKLGAIRMSFGYDETVDFNPEEVGRVLIKTAEMLRKMTKKR